MENDIRIMALGGLLAIGRIRGAGQKSLFDPLILQSEGKNLHFLKLIGKPDRLFINAATFTYVPDEPVCAAYIEATTNIIVPIAGGK